MPDYNTDAYHFGEPNNNTICTNKTMPDIHAHWEFWKEHNYDGALRRVYYCSKCNILVDIMRINGRWGLLPYQCPACQAIMDEKEKER